MTNRNRQVEATPNISVSLVEQFPGNFRAAVQPGAYSVNAVTVFDGTFSVNRDPEVVERWQGNHTLDSLALRAAGLGLVVCDAILLTGRPNARGMTGGSTAARIKRLQDERDVNLSGLVSSAFEEGAFRVDQPGAAIGSPELEVAKELLWFVASGVDQDTIVSLTGLSRRTLTRRLGNAYEALGVDTAQAATTRIRLGALAI